MKHYTRKITTHHTGYVYFVQMDRIGPIKIGYTKNIGKRIVTLQISSPYPLRLLCLFPTDELSEKEIHHCYNDSRLEGEWFLPHPVILADIDEINMNNLKSGFVNPIPEFDLLDDCLDPYRGLLDNSEALYWKRWLESFEYQAFKKSKSIEERRQLIQKYLIGFHPLIPGDHERWDEEHGYKTLVEGIV